MKQAISKQLNTILVVYSPKFPKIIAHMLETSKYQINAYIKALIQTDDFNEVLPSHKFKTSPRALFWQQLVSGGVILEIITGLALIIDGLVNHLSALDYYGAALIVVYPLVWPLLVVLAMPIVNAMLIVTPKKTQTSPGKPKRK